MIFSWNVLLISKSTMSHTSAVTATVISVDQNYVETQWNTVSKLWGKQAFEPLSTLQWLLWTDSLVFLTTSQDWGTKVQQQILWYRRFCGLFVGIYITEAFRYSKTFTSNEAGMPHRRTECHRGSGDSSNSPAWQFILFSSLLGGICSLTIMSFIPACVALCQPDLCTKVGSLICV